MEKKDLRKSILNSRNSLSKKDILNKSSIILDKLQNLDKFKNSKNIMFYLSYSSEVYTLNLVKNLLNKKNILIPYITDFKNGKMIASKLNSFNILKENKKGILEPKEDCVIPFEKENIDIIITPAVAFDKNKYRLGYGGGFYDRFFENTKAFKIGLAYDFAILDKVPTNNYDLPCDMIITDKRIFL